MKKNILLVALLFTVVTISAQKYQRIAYIDMEYILQNILEYAKAQNALNLKVEKWRKNLDKQTRHIEVLKTDLVNEKAILTKDLIEEREEDISLKQEELRRLESLYFGAKGTMYSLRKQLVQPIQDQVYNAIQNIAVRKKYDFVFDKSSDLVMLYSNKKHDISDLVLKIINQSQKRKDKKEKQAKKRNKTNNKELSKEQKEKLAKIKASKTKKLEKRKARKQAIEEKRQAYLKAHEEKKRLLQKKRDSLKKVRADKN